MVDLIDKATQEITANQEERLQALRYKVANLKKQSSQFCIECGEPIPAERQRAISGCRLCFDCQQAKEEKQNVKF